MQYTSDPHSTRCVDIANAACIATASRQSVSPGKPVAP